MGRNNRNARSRPHGRRIHVNKYISKVGRTKAKDAPNAKHSMANVNPAVNANPQPHPDRTEAVNVRAEGLNARIDNHYARPCATGPLPRRYEIWFADLGDHYGTSVQSGNRPVLIVSNDVANVFSNTVTVIPLTTKFKKLELPTRVFLCQDDCYMLRPEIMQDSLLLAEQITTIAKSALSNRLCRVVSQEKKYEVECAIASQLGMQPAHLNGHAVIYGNGAVILEIDDVAMGTADTMDTAEPTTTESNPKEETAW